MLIKLSKALETKRIIIRPLTQEDLDYLLLNSNNKDRKKDFQLIYDNEESDKVSFSFSMRESHQILGFITFKALEKKGEIEVYYELLPLYTRNGYTIEALKKMFEYIFANNYFTTIIAYVDQGNSRGWRAAERSGMKYMGENVRKSSNSKSMLFMINNSDYINQYQF